KQTLHARWNESLVSTKDGGFDCLRLRGDAMFYEDDGEPAPAGQPTKAPKQMLQAQQLNVWMLPAKQPTGNNSDDPQSRVRVDRVDAQGNVRSDSAEFHILPPTDHLRVVFHDAKLPAGPSPLATSAVTATMPAPSPPAPRQSTSRTATPRPTTAGSSVATGPTRPPASRQPASTTPTKPKKPMDLSARFVKVEVLRWPDHNEVRDLRCEGEVIVHQDPATPDERGVNIRGELLLLTKVGPDAYDLNVRGDLASVQLDKITIHGPEVKINQQTNEAEVTGIGILQMPATHDFNGNALNKATDLTIHWQKHMLFEGAARRALFEGKCQANQGTGGLLCDVLQVSLDRPVSFKQGAPSGQSARVDRLVCDKDVYLEDNPQEDGRVVGFQRLATPSVEMDNTNGTVMAGGPGILHIVKQGGADDDPLAPPSNAGTRSRTASAGKKKTGKDLKKDTNDDKLTLTQVKYVDRLSGDNQKRLAIFYGDVEVIHGAVDRKVLLNHALLNVDRDYLPPGFMYLRSDKLTVYNGNATGAASRQSQSMRAEGHVTVRARDFWGDAAIATYDEDKDAIVLDGNGGMATLYRVIGQGQKPDVVTGRKIKYWRQTNNYQVEHAGQSLIGQ
ncbi:MAG TPA: LptA/OstA family protein, partial [Gemmataceae bacterium]|nr:LptA/OstA family protein [Gemmataceae bacterium]